MSVSRDVEVAETHESVDVAPKREHVGVWRVDEAVGDDPDEEFGEEDGAERDLDERVPRDAHLTVLEVVVATVERRRNTGDGDGRDDGGENDGLEGDSEALLRRAAVDPLFAVRRVDERLTELADARILRKEEERLVVRWVRLDKLGDRVLALALRLLLQPFALLNRCFSDVMHAARRLEWRRRGLNNLGESVEPRPELESHLGLIDESDGRSCSRWRRGILRQDMGQYGKADERDPRKTNLLVLGRLDWFRRARHAAVKHFFGRGRLLSLGTSSQTDRRVGVRVEPLEPACRDRACWTDGVRLELPQTLLLLGELETLVEQGNEQVADDEIADEHPTAEKHGGEDDLQGTLLVRDDRLEDVRPILAREDLIHGEERVENLVEGERAGVVVLETGDAAKELDGDERGEIGEQEEEQNHVDEGIDRSDEANEEALHARDREDDAVEPCDLEAGQPNVGPRAEDAWELDDARRDGKEDVDMIGGAAKEASPVGQARKHANGNLDVESEREAEFGPVERVRLRLTHVVRAARLQRDRDYDEGDPDQSCLLVDLGHEVGAFAQAAVRFSVVVELHLDRQGAAQKETA